MADKIQIRRDTAAQWTALNPVLNAGEWGMETTDGRRYKLGDGVTAWNALGYASPAPPATTEEMQAGTEIETRTVSPSLIADAIAAQAPAQNASQVAVTPTGSIAGTNVQAVLAELDNEKSPTGHNHDAAYAPLSHVGAGGAAHAAATTGAAGFMSAADKTKLNGIEDGATAGGGLSEAAVEALFWPSAGSPPSTPFVRMYQGSGGGADQRAAIQAELNAIAATGGVLLIAGEARIDGSLTYPTSVPSYLGVVGIGGARLLAGGTQNFKLIDFSGYATNKDCTVEIEGLRLVGGVDQFIVGGTKTTITAASSDGTTATFTASGHGVSVGNPVIVRGCTPAGYNGDWIVASVSGTQFTATIGSNPGAYTANSGTVQRACPAKVNVTAASWASGTVTFTASGHGRSVGDLVAVTGAAPAGYNGDFIVTAVSGTQFSAALAADPGTWTSGGAVSDFADSSHRGIKIDYMHTVRVRRCIVEATRGFAISIDKCTDASVEDCTVLRAAKDAINVNNTVLTRIARNTVHGCGDNGIAAHTGVLTTGTCSIGAITMANGSSVIDVAFTSSNSAEPGDVIVFTGTSPNLNNAGGAALVNLKGQWRIVAKPTGSTAQLVADYTNTAGVTISNSASAAFEIGAGAERRRAAVHVVGNTVVQAFGIKVLGGSDVICTGNVIRNCHNYGVYLGCEGNGGEGHVAPRSLLVADNIIEDVIHHSYLGLSGAYNTGIFVDYRWKTIESLLIARNTINCSTQVTLGTTRPSDLKRGYCQPNGGLSDEHRFFFADGYRDTIFTGSQPIYQRHIGISIRARNAGDRAALRVIGNTYLGVKMNGAVPTARESVERYVPVTDGKRHRFTTPTSNTNLEGGSYLGTAADLDLRPYYVIGTRVKSGNPTLTGAQFTVKFRPQGASAVFCEASAGVDFATNAATFDSTVNKEFTGSDKALANPVRNLIEAVPFGYAGSAGAIEVYDFELVLKADGDDCALDAPGGEAFVTSPNPNEQGAIRSFVRCTQTYYDGLTAQQRDGIAFDIVAA